MANMKMEVLHEIIASMNRFMENQTRIMNSLVSQIKELQNRVASYEVSREDNLRTRLDEMASVDTVPELPRTAMDSNEDPIRFNASRGSSVGTGAPPIASLCHQPLASRNQEEPPRPVPRRNNVCENRRASLGTRLPVPLPRNTTPRTAEVHTTSQPSASVRCSDTFAIEGPCQRRARVAVGEVQRQSPPHSQKTTRPPPPTRYLRSTRHPPLPRSSLPWRRHRGIISPWQERPGDSRTQRITERGVRGYIRFFMAERKFGFVTRSDNGGNIFFHRNELINIPRDSAVTLQEGDEVLFDVMWTSRTPTARNAKLVSMTTS